jgi:hypothetical protein
MASIRPLWSRSCHHVLYDVLLALLEPLSLIEHHPVQAPAHERHALREDLFHSAFGDQRVHDRRPVSLPIVGLFVGVDYRLGAQDAVRARVEPDGEAALRGLWPALFAPGDCLGTQINLLVAGARGSTYPGASRQTCGARPVPGGTRSTRRPGSLRVCGPPGASQTPPTPPRAVALLPLERGGRGGAL